MANKVLTTEGWEERIRAKFRLTVNQLSDADIRQPDVIDMAEAMVADAVPAWSDIIAAGGNNKIYLESAVVNICASLLCPSMSQRLALVRGPLMTIDYGDIDWSAKAREFWDVAIIDIGRCNDTGVARAPVVPFMAVGPSRVGVVMGGW